MVLMSLSKMFFEGRKYEERKGAEKGSDGFSW